jgi:hypothetical protein
MNDSFQQPEPRRDVVDRLRALALRGATVRELVAEIVSCLGLKEDAVLPILWYFTRAFCLPLSEVLPIREWLGTDRDEEIDALILPAIERARGTWAGAPVREQDNLACRDGLTTSQPWS